MNETDQITNRPVQSDGVNIVPPIDFVIVAIERNDVIEGLDNPVTWWVGAGDARLTRRFDTLTEARRYAESLNPRTVRILRS